jgi:NitT/TauT family transport system permease protein
VTSAVTGTVAPEQEAARSAAGSRRRRSMLPPVISWVILIVVIGLWQLIGDSPSMQSLISTPALVVERFGSMARDGQLWANLVPTMEETLGGLVIGTAVGIVGGVVMARSKLAGAVLDPYVVAINGVPRVALGPFFVVWFGIGIASKVLLAVSIVFVFVLFNVRSGLENIDQDLVDALRTMRANRLQMMWYVTFPSLVPWLLAATKVSIGAALTGAVVGELVGATAGLGYYLTSSLNQTDVTGAVTALLIMAVIAIIMYYLVILAERRLLSWQRHSAEVEVS